MALYSSTGQQGKGDDKGNTPVSQKRRENSNKEGMEKKLVRCEKSK